MSEINTANKTQLKINYVFDAIVSDVSEQFVPAYVLGSGIGKDAQFIQRSQGWFMFLEGSHEALHLGAERPALAKGDKVKITVEKVNG